MSNTHFRKFSSHDDYIDALNNDELSKHNISYCEDMDEVHYDPYKFKYFTIHALETGNVYFYYAENEEWNISQYGTGQTWIEYSKNKGETWIRTERTSSAAITVTIPMIKGESIYMRGKNQSFSGYNEVGSESDSQSRIYSDIRFNVSGNIMSLLNYQNFYTNYTLEYEKSFAYFFAKKGNQNCFVVDASNLVLPSPEVPIGCYGYMFYGCSTLIKAPNLPGTELEWGCYTAMFSGCSSLTTAPELPATTLSGYCYSAMFSSCSSLTTAPELPALYLPEGAYLQMFLNCSNLNYIKAMFRDMQNHQSIDAWASFVAPTGTLVKNTNTNWGDEEQSIVPSGWTVETVSE